MAEKVFFIVTTKYRPFARNVDIKRVMAKKRFFIVITNKRTLSQNVDILIVITYVFGHPFMKLI